MAVKKITRRSETFSAAGIPANVATYTINVLRRNGWARWVPKWNVMKAAKRSYGKYECAACKQLFGPKEMQCDHIEPVVPVSGWVSFDDYIRRLFVTEDKLQALCVTCHKDKSIAEAGQRAEGRRNEGEKDT